MGGNAVDDGRVLAVLRGHLHAQLDMRAVVLVRQHLADVVQQRAALRELDVELQLGGDDPREPGDFRSEEHTSELQSQSNLVCRLLLEKKKTVYSTYATQAQEEIRRLNS